MINRILFIASICLASSAALAQDAPADRAAAAERYLRAVPMSKILDDTAIELSKQFPPEQRPAFVQKMKAAVRPDVLEKIARTSMIDTFTADELNALADFYGSKHGNSAMQKFGRYMGQVMPAVQAELQRCFQQIVAEKKQ